MTAVSASFVFVGSTASDAALSQLKARNVPYKEKRLESTPANWATITELFLAPTTKAAVLKLSANNFKVMRRADYRAVAEPMFAALGAIPHLVLIHEANMTGVAELPEPREPTEFDEVFDPYESRYEAYFNPPPAADREYVLGLLKESGISPVPYTTNAELSVLTARFVQDNERNLLFRIYVPSSRIYAREAERLLSLFRDWLTQVRFHSVREDGYSTGNGRVFEFYGDHDLVASDLPAQFDDFSRFLELCSSDPGGAERQMATWGIDAGTSSDIVNRYGRETRRLNLDLRQARETKMLALKHRVEVELSEAIAAGDVDPRGLEDLIESSVPRPSTSAETLSASSGMRQIHIENLNVEVNQQVVDTVHGALIQDVGGGRDLSADALRLIDLIGTESPRDATDLITAVHELEDESAPPDLRIRARQRIKAFLMRGAATIEAGAMTALQKYVENKLGA